MGLTVAARTSIPLMLALLLPGCTTPLETLGPTPADEGITLYLHAGFAGTSQAINRDVGDLGQGRGPVHAR